MDPDSFLNLLSPELNELDDWCSPPSETAQPLTWLSDTIIQEPESALHSIVSNNENASDYSSVLKLSDIASALHSFSRASVLPAPKPSPTPRCSNLPASPPPIAVLSSSNGLLTPIKSSVRPAMDVDEIEDYNELHNCIDNHCDYNNDYATDESDDDGDDDVKPSEGDALPEPPSHVKIIRRPFSHVMAPATKRSNVSPTNTEASEISSQQKAFKREGMSQREVHILSERQRRKSMRDSFTILQSLVPKLKLKHTDRITVLTEVITYIKSLRGTLEELERKKTDIMDFLGLSDTRKHQYVDTTNVSYVNSSSDNYDQQRGESGSNGELVVMVEVTVRLSGADVFITLNTPRRKGVWSRVLMLLQKYSVEVSNATLASSGESSFHCIHGKVTSISSIEGIDLQDKLEGVIVKELRRRPRR